MSRGTTFSGRAGLKAAAWGLTLVAAGFFVWPFVGLVVDPDEPKRLTIFGVSFAAAFMFFVLAQLLWYLVRRETFDMLRSPSTVEGQREIESQEQQEGR